MPKCQRSLLQIIFTDAVTSKERTQADIAKERAQGNTCLQIVYDKSVVMLYVLLMPV